MSTVPQNGSYEDSERLRRIEQIVERCMAALASDHPVDMDALKQHHADLMPELAERLSAARLIIEAGRRACADPPSPLDATQSAFEGNVATRLPGYQIVREIHRGGQGIVYQAVQIATRRKVAIKMMREGPFAGPRDRARFEREVQILGQLNHPHIVGVHDSGVADGHFYFVMDYISGEPLDAHVAKLSRASSSTGSRAAAAKSGIDEILRLFAKIGDAVGAAHLKGVIHRDLKPGNIRVDGDGEPHILDFGLAKTIMGEATDGDRAQVMTVTGQFVGSLPWASPEQAEGMPSKIDVRTDVYSLGVILYQMLTGRFPYEVTGTMGGVLDTILHQEPSRPSSVSRRIDDEIDTIVMKCLCKERERRYQSAVELGRDIRHYLAGEPIEAKRDSTIYVLRKRLRRHRGAVIASIAVLGTAAVAIWTTMILTRRLATQTDRPPVTEMVRSRLAESLDRNLRSGVPQDVFKEPSSGAPVETDAVLDQWWSITDAEFDERIRELTNDTLFLRSQDGALTPNSAIVDGPIQWTADGKTGRARIRRTARWHDGQPLSSRDIAYSFSMNGVKNESLLRVVVDRDEVIFEFAAPTATRGRLMNFILTRPNDSAHIAAEKDKAGCGPYRITSHDDDLTVLDRWNEYPAERQQPRFARINVRRSLREIPANTVVAFLREKACACVEIKNDDDFNRFRVGRDAEFAQVGYAVSFPQNLYNLIVWNQTRRPELFGDRRVRRAMAHAFNLGAAMADCGMGPENKVGGIFPLLSWAYEPLTPYVYDPDEAKRLLREAGWSDSAGTWSRTFQGARVEFGFKIGVSKAATTSRHIVRMFCADLARIGIQAEELLLEPRIPPSKQADALVQGLRPAVDPDLDRRFWHSVHGAGPNETPVSCGYANPRVDEMFDRASITLDMTERRKLYLDIQRLVYEDQPVLFLYHRPSMWAISKRLRGLEFGLRGPFLFYPGVAPGGRQSRFDRRYRSPLSAEAIPQFTASLTSYHSSASSVDPLSRPLYHHHPIPVPLSV